MRRALVLLLLGSFASSALAAEIHDQIFQPGYAYAEPSYQPVRGSLARLTRCWPRRKQYQSSVTQRPPPTGKAAKRHSAASSAFERLGTLKAEADPLADIERDLQETRAIIAELTEQVSLGGEAEKYARGML